MLTIAEMLRLSAARHSHLCPRQVLGVRMGVAGLATLGLASPVTKPTGLVIVETDGCFVDGVEIATGATVGHRTLRVMDMGKLAATFVDVQSGRAMRLAPRAGIRSLAFAYAPEQDERYTAQLRGYEVIPEEELFHKEEVRLDPPLEVLLSTPEARALCSNCGEEIINGREVVTDQAVLCQSCRGGSYYTAGVSRSAVKSDSDRPLDQL